jgi:hypothetical protein
MSRLLSVPALLGLLCLLLVVAVSPMTAQITFNEYQMTNNSGDDASIDAAMDASGNLHLVYVRGGNVYYKRNLGDEELVAAGSEPAIAVDASGIAHVAYMSGGLVYYNNRTGGSWQTPVSLAHANPGYLDIDVDASAKAHIVYGANDDGDSYYEIFYATNSTGAFVESLLADGWYDSGSGNYFHRPCIKVDGSGYYHIAYEQDNWGGRASWSDKGISMTTNATSGSGSTGGFDWNGGVTVARNGVVIDGSGLGHVLYYSGSTLYDGTVGASWSATSFASGSQPSMASYGSTIAAAYNDGSNNVTYIESTGSGYGSAQTVCSGQNPVVVLHGGRYILFERSDGSDLEVYLRSDVAPLPVQLVSFCAVSRSAGSELTWKTMSETNNYGFYVQRRGASETAFADIDGAFIAGHGTSAVPQQYSFVDPSGVAGSWYRLRQVDLDGTTHYSDAVQAGIATSVEESTPQAFRLLQNYPNPFNPTTVVSYQLPAAAMVHLVVFDLLGREVATLVNETQPAGAHSVTFDARGLSSGSYICRLTAGGASLTQTMLLMR